MIDEFIPTGRENAVSRSYLAKVVGKDDRKVRRMIEEARAAGALICNDQDGKGYWISEDPKEWLAQYRQDTARAMRILKRRKPLRDALIAAGYKEETR